MSPAPKSTTDRHATGPAGATSGAAPPGPDSARSGPGNEVAAILPYLAPIFAYVALGGLENALPRIDATSTQPEPHWYAAAYAARVAVVSLIAVWFRATWRDFRPLPSFAGLMLALVAGLVVFLLWIGLDGRYPALPFMGTRAAFDPSGLGTPARWAFIAVRMLGLVVLVPLIEELFWRSFLIRWLIDQDFHKVPIGRVTPIAALGSAGMFALAHPEWLPALLTGLIWAWLLHQTKSVSACAASHVVANLALGIYVLVSGDWKYW